MVVEPEIRQVAETGDGTDLGHAPQFLANDQVTEHECGCGEHEQQDRVAGAVNQPGHTDHGKGAADSRHGGEADGERAENLGAAEKRLR